MGFRRLTILPLTTFSVAVAYFFASLYPHFPWVKRWQCYWSLSVILFRSRVSAPCWWRIKGARDRARWGKRETGVETSVSLCLGRALLAILRRAMGHQQGGPWDNARPRTWELQRLLLFLQSLWQGDLFLPRIRSTIFSQTTKPQEKGSLS